MSQSLSDCTVHIIGLGLMGGSLAMALRDKVQRITAEDLLPGVLEAGLERGVIDAVGTADQADMVVIAIPAHQIIPLIPTLKLRPRHAGDRPGQHQNAHLRRAGPACRLT